MPTDIIMAMFIYNSANILWLLCSQISNCFDITPLCCSATYMFLACLLKTKLFLHLKAIQLLYMCSCILTHLESW